MPTGTTMPPSGDAIFADDFESGSLAAWDTAVTDGGDLSASPAAALNGNIGLLANFDDNAAIYVADNLSPAEPRYRVRFLVHTNGVAMAPNESFMLFEGYTSANLSILRVEVRRFNNTYQMRAMVRNDANGWANTGWWVLSDALHAVELDWQAATGANNGSLTLWIDGVQRSQVANLDNDMHSMGMVRLGATGGVWTGTRGSVYVDSFESRRMTFIGLPTVAQTAAQAAAFDGAEGAYLWPEEYIYLPSISR